ncbi:MAG TPA: phosphopantetheine-binding protein [Burkholderiaceae bacterium]|jgi:acyl carrier protein|nr:phosphopantetheine-binding protein [Burkholderiaceae bacterium]
MKADEFLRTMVLELKDIDEAELVPEAVIEELDLDSLDYVEIQVGIKKNFGVSVDPELFQSGKIRTLGDLCRYIEEQQAAALATAE